MDSNLIVGNLCSLLAMGTNSISATRKTTKGVLFFQSLSQMIYFVVALVLGGYSAAVQNVVSILRNIAAIRNVKSKTIEWILTVAGAVFGVVFNNRGLVGLFPVLGNLQYTLMIFRFKDNERILKLSFLISTASFVVFNLVIGNFVGATMDMVVITTTAVNLIKATANKSKK